MRQALVTSFEPYGEWTTNASWLCLQSLTRDLPEQPKLVTRRYPVDFKRIADCLEKDLQASYDAVLLLGQAPGSAAIQLETFALNVAQDRAQEPTRPLTTQGPVAYRTTAPVARLAAGLRSQGIPAIVSHHAGAYLCNAAFYWAHHLLRESSPQPPILFAHLPLTPEQSANMATPPASMSSEMTSRAVRFLVAELTCPPPLA